MMMGKDTEKRAREAVVRNSPKVTPKMTAYIDGLCISCGLAETRIRRNAWISGFVGREIKYLDEMTMQEGHRVIAELEVRRGESRFSRDDRDADDGGDGDERWNRRN